MFKIPLFAVLAIVAIIVCVLVLAALKPARFMVTRSLVVQRSRENVFALINDLHRWPEWSVDGQEDAKIKRTYSGAGAGQGAICEMEGTGKSGKVRLEIVESSPSVVRVQADWERPFAAQNFNAFTLEPQGEATRVTWTLDGENVFMLKVMTVFVSQEKLMGSHLEKGLAALKAAAEK